MSTDESVSCEYIRINAPNCSAFLANRIRQDLTSIRLGLADLSGEDQDVKDALDRLERIANALAG